MAGVPRQVQQDLGKHRKHASGRIQVSFGVIYDIMSALSNSVPILLS